MVCAPKSRTRLRPLLVAVLAFGVLVAGLFLGVLLLVGCSENLHPGTDRTRACEAWESGFRWWLLVTLPPALLLVGGFLPGKRRFSLGLMICVVLGFGAVWAYLLLVVSSNIGDTSIG